ncbi:ATP-binding cassette domain-containing protein [Halovulum dunhuangense]|uniref:ATP-binding cassette domain-containing protein n=1 Tax=Halovulum dunhuangense TaxID=1505036 RepID=A0A849L1A2_9RHOB|nr:oligopeptide/dipeptide ABC transporter ATP-binding protein [Halovulum dunhuangense]NNU80066.1 ATP-binding cassette domain-containing protein [Halovulum dunhuangense]
MTALLKARGLRKTYATRRGGFMRAPTRFAAVDGVDVTLLRGRTLGILGESGCGKSTLARLVLGLAEPDAGTVNLGGAAMPRPDTPEWRKLRTRLQLVQQDAAGALDPRLPIRAQVAEPLAIHGRDQAAADAVLSSVGLNRAMGARFPHELSGGQLQRVVIARALALDPEILVLDEPVSALDVSIQAQIVNLIADLQAARGLAYLFVSHDVNVVRHVSDRIAVMYLGRVVEEAPAAAFGERARHPYTRALLSSVPVPDPAHRRAGVPRIGDPPDPSAPPGGCRFHPRCPHATDLCRAEVPPLRSLSAGHAAACHRIEEITKCA